LVISASAGPSKAQLGVLCEALLLFREQQDREGQEELYRDTLRLLSGGDKQVRGAAGDIWCSSSSSRAGRLGQFYLVAQWQTCALLHWGSVAHHLEPVSVAYHHQAAAAYTHYS
jgi:hypothetical protein